MTQMTKSLAARSSVFALATGLLILLQTAPVSAAPPSIEKVRADALGGAWTFSVTLRHGDTGWDHYADGWEVLTPNGKRLGYRELVHPHVNEQPFTRSLSGVLIPAGTAYVLVRAHCSVDGWNTTTTRVDLPN